MGSRATQPDLDHLREDVRSFLEHHLTAELRARVAATGTYHDRAFARALGDRGWVVPGWPIAEGGAGLGGLAQSILEEELQYAHAPIDGIGTTRMVGSCIRRWGTPSQRAELCPKVAAGELLISLGYTEPDAGSDVAAVRTRAVRDGDTWVISGEKLFTTLAHEADYIFLLTRTNTDVPRRKGLTMFLVPTSSPGFSVAPIHTLSGERTNTTVYDDVRLPDTARIGDVDRGWEVLGTALELEHAVGFGAALERMVHVSGRLLDTTASEAARLALARATIDAEISKLLQREAAVREGHDPAIGPMAKLFSSEAFCHHSGVLLDLLGPRGLTSNPSVGASALPAAAETAVVPDGVAEVELAYRHSHVTRIFAGTSEIQRSIIAERGLGLPRSRRL